MTQEAELAAFKERLLALDVDIRSKWIDLGVERLLARANAMNRLLADECDRYGLPHDLVALLRHLEGNRAMTEAALAHSNSILRERVEAMAVVVEAHCQVLRALGDLRREWKLTPVRDMPYNLGPPFVQLLEAAYSGEAALDAYEAQVTP